MIQLSQAYKDYIINPPTNWDSVPNHLLYLTLTNQANISPSLNHPKPHNEQETTHFAQSLLMLFNLVNPKHFPCPALSFPWKTQ